MEIDVTKDNALDELSQDLKSIRDNRVDINKKSLELDKVVEYCIDRHDRSLTKLLEMERFLEQNLDLFYIPEDTFIQRSSSDKNWGCRNYRNNVLMYRNASGTIVQLWLDHGLTFWYVPQTKKVVYIGHNLDEKVSYIGSGISGNSSCHHVAYNFFPMYVDGNFPSDGYERFFVPPTSLSIDSRSLTSYEYVSELKKKVDADHENVIKACKCLVDAVLDIRKCELDYYCDMENMVSSVKTKGKDGS